MADSVPPRGVGAKIGGPTGAPTFVPGANQLVELALANYQKTPGLKALWDVVRQLGQGNIYTASIAPQQDVLSPTSIPGGVLPESVLAMPSPQGPVLAVFTNPEGPSKMPGEAPPNMQVRVQPAIAAAAVGSKEPYAGICINPGTPGAAVIPAEMLRVALPQGKTNIAAKNLLNSPSPTIEQRQAMVEALASGPLYTAIARHSVAAAQQGNSPQDGDNAEKGIRPVFPLIPLDGSAPAATTNANPGDGEAEGGVSSNMTPLPAGTPAALVFGTSPAEVAALFDPELWVPVPMRIADVIKAVGQTADIKMVLVNPGGPALHLPITSDDVAAAAQAIANEAADKAAAEAKTAREKAAAEVVEAEEVEADNGPGTEPDGGTREGED